MLQLQEDISRIRATLAVATAQFNNHKETTNTVHKNLQSTVSALEERKIRLLQASARSRSPSPPVSLPLASFRGVSPLQAFTPRQQAQRQVQAAVVAGLRPASATVPQLLPQAGALLAEPVARAPGAVPMMGFPMGSRSNIALGSGPLLAPQVGTPVGGRSPQILMRSL